MFKIQIPKPCHADWNEMTPTQQGAFCGSCNKEVVDFTNMSDEAIKNYFLQRSTGSTCGRFRTEQIHRIRISLPPTIFVQKIAGWKKFMAVVMLAFGSMLFGCDVGVDNNIVGKVEKIDTVTTRLTGDTSVVDINYGTMGMVSSPIVPDKIKCVDSTNYGVMTGTVVAMPVERNEVMGDVGVVPDTVVQPSVDTISFTKMGEIAIPEPVRKKPASDTGKCKDPGFY